MNIFHQNMRVFGGGAPLRNIAYQAAFAGIAGGLGGVGGPIGVAGFTEVMNNGATAVAFGPGGPVGGLCAALGVGFLGNVACGQMALAPGPEYVGLGIDPAAAVNSVGRICFNQNGAGVNLIHDVFVGAIGGGAWNHWCNNLPANATADYRGVVYVVVTFPGGPQVAVGFVHNLYAIGVPGIAAQRMPDILFLMRNNPTMPGGGGGPAYVGGDFNLLPIVRHTVAHGNAYPYSAATVAVPVGAVAGGTTWAGNLYDY